MNCIRCDLEIMPTDKVLINDEGEVAHDNCIGWDDIDENWVEISE